MKNYFLILLVPLFAAGCASSSAPTTSSSPTTMPLKTSAIDVCALLTKAEATTFLEKQAEDGKATTRSSFPYGSTCSYITVFTAGDSLKGAGHIATITVYEDRDELKAADWFHRQKTALTQYESVSGKVETIDGLGDEAFSNNLGVHILTKNKYVLVRIGALTEVMHDPSLAAARLVISRL